MNSEPTVLLGIWEFFGRICTHLEADSEQSWPLRQHWLEKENEISVTCSVTKSRISATSTMWCDRGQSRLSLKAVMKIKNGLFVNTLWSLFTLEFNNIKTLFLHLISHNFSLQLPWIWSVFSPQWLVCDCCVLNEWSQFLIKKGITKRKALLNFLCIVPKLSCLYSLLV